MGEGKTSGCWTGHTAPCWDTCRRNSAIIAEIPAPASAVCGGAAGAWSAAQLKKRLEELLELVGHDQRFGIRKMRRFPAVCCNGWGLPEAMLNNPKLLILDEPTAGRIQRNGCASAI